MTLAPDAQEAAGGGERSPCERMAMPVAIRSLSRSCIQEASHAPQARTRDNDNATCTRQRLLKPDAVLSPHERSRRARTSAPSWRIPVEERERKEEHDLVWVYGWSTCRTHNVTHGKRDLADAMICCDGGIPGEAVYCRDNISPESCRTLARHAPCKNTLVAKLPNNCPRVGQSCLGSRESNNIWLSDGRVCFPP